MRLKEIKLAGFKSFVDPTTVVLPGNRVAVVGPNGCGKSNIIDAVRWVMGESSARQLRGEALTDVIFNGANSRQSTSLASVELLFDNRDGRVGGKFASYAELAIRREVDRASQSIYYLNGTRCRRRDIADVFLGTGFGPRSYSIVEQGMIAELVEAKPDQLRAYIEEAAGVSKYRERRHETQNRIRHTLENLQRLADIREELERQLARLQKQAKDAERFHRLKDEETQRRAELHIIRLNAIDAQIAEQEQAVRNSTVKFEEAQSVRQTVETALERSRSAHAEQTDEHSQAQGTQYEINGQAGKLEEAIRFDRQRIADLQQELQTLTDREAEIGRQLADDSAQLKATEDKIRRQAPILSSRRDASESAAKAVQALEEQASVKEREWVSFSNRANRNDGEIRVCSSSIEHADGVNRQLQERLAKLQGQELPPPDDGLDALAKEVETANANVAALGGDLDENGQTLASARQRIEALENEVADCRLAAQQERRQLAAIEALQQAALGRNAKDGEVDEWLDGSGLRDESRLGETLQVDAGWEAAVELVLGSNVQAIVVANVTEFAAKLENLGQGRLMLLDGTASPPPAKDGVPALASFVRGNMGSLANGVLAAESTAEAHAARPNLEPGQSIVTRDGLWLGPDWIRLERKSADTSEDQAPEAATASIGAIRGTQELAARQAAADAADAQLASAEQQLAEARQNAAELDGEREALRTRHASATASLGKLRTDYELRRQRAEEATARARRLAEEQRETRAQIERETERLRNAQAQLTELQAASETLRSEGEELERERERHLGELNAARRTAHEAANEYLQAQQEDAHLRARLAATETTRNQLIEQREALRSRAQQARASVDGAQADLPAKEKAHQAKLDEALAIEAVLRELRGKLGHLEAEIQELTAKRVSAEQVLDTTRSELEQARLERERLVSKRDGEQTQFAETGMSEQDARANLADDATEEQWQEQLASIARRIQRLGAINLAAIDEYESQSERKQYLDRQNEDLETALATLQEAIQRIDRDTRTRFKATFEQLNENLKALFPKVFGGGRAALVLTGDDWLETGVTLVAQPPGKRNTSIQLLSGGEKAMTAVALIFAIFQLNPSPVCLLDEVDAPLDDNNVQRFADLIREMSQDVQFVVVTHNKQTIEMADHLLGVTMQEAGVSRLVSVDVDQAARMAAAG